MEWISIKDKMPKDFEDRCENLCVFVCASNPDEDISPIFSIAQHYDDHWCILDDCGGYSCIGWYPLKSEDITHWCFIDYLENNQPERLSEKTSKEDAIV